jgi:regulatory protein
VEQQPQRLRAQGSRGRERGGSTLDLRTKGQPSRTEAPLKLRSPDAAYKAGVRFLTARDRTSAELARLLAARGFAQADSCLAIERLKEQGYLNDRRVATAWARGRLQMKPMGPYRLSRELETKGVDSQLVREVLEEVYDESEESVARRAMASKLSACGSRPAPSRTAPVARFLYRRGFSAEIIRRLLHGEQQG